MPPAFFEIVGSVLKMSRSKMYKTILISLRERDMSQVTFLVTLHALEFLFSNTLERDWPLFEKTASAFGKTLAHTIIA